MSYKYRNLAGNKPASYILESPSGVRLCKFKALNDKEADKFADRYLAKTGRARVIVVRESFV